MTRDADQPAALQAKDEPFLQRWSRRKRAAARDAAPESTAPAIEQPPASAVSPIEDSHASPQDVALAQPPAPLPAIESLTFDSDFRAFLQPHVAEDLKRQALRKLLHDPRFNVMDGLDVYIDDYSVPSPLAPAVARSLAQARYIFEPPQTRVNAAGHVEDVPAAEADALVEGHDSEGHDSEGHDSEGHDSEGHDIEHWADQNGTTEDHTTPPHESRGDAVADFLPAEERPDDWVLPRRGGRRGRADRVVGERVDPVEERMDRAAAAERALPAEKPDEGGATR